VLVACEEQLAWRPVVALRLAGASSAAWRLGAWGAALLRGPGTNDRAAACTSPLPRSRAPRHAAPNLVALCAWQPAHARLVQFHKASSVPHLCSLTNADFENGASTNACKLSELVLGLHSELVRPLRSQPSSALTPATSARLPDAAPSEVSAQCLARPTLRCSSFLG